MLYWTGFDESGLFASSQENLSNQNYADFNYFVCRILLGIRYLLLTTHYLLLTTLTTKLL